MQAVEYGMKFSWCWYERYEHRYYPCAGGFVKFPCASSLASQPNRQKDIHEHGQEEIGNKDR